MSERGCFLFEVSNHKCMFFSSDSALMDNSQQFMLTNPVGPEEFNKYGYNSNELKEARRNSLSKEWKPEGE